MAYMGESDSVSTCSQDQCGADEENKEQRLPNKGKFLTVF